MHIDVFAVLWHNIERGRVVDFNSTHFDSFSGHKINKLWSMSNIQVKEFSDPPHEALTIDLTTSWNLDIDTIIENQEVLMFSWFMLSSISSLRQWPLFVPFGCKDETIDHNLNIIQVFKRGWSQCHHKVFWNKNNPVALRRVGSSYCLDKCISVSILLLQSSLTGISNFTVIQDTMGRGAHLDKWNN